MWTYSQETADLFSFTDFNGNCLFLRSVKFICLNSRCESHVLKRLYEITSLHVVISKEASIVLQTVKWPYDGGPNSHKSFVKCRVNADFQIAGNSFIWTILQKKGKKSKRAETVRNRVGFSAIELIGIIAHNEKLRKCYLLIRNL